MTRKINLQKTKNTQERTVEKRWLDDELRDKENNKQDPVARTGSKESLMAPD